MKNLWQSLKNLNSRQLIIAISVTLIALLILTAVIVRAGVGNSHLVVIRPTGSASPTTTSTSPTATSQKDMCTSETSIPGLASSSLSNLQKLNEYQQYCHSAVTNRMMYFTTISSRVNAQSDAVAMAKTLMEFSRYGISPLIIDEPGTIPFKQFVNGSYDRALDTYFQTLKDQGVTDEQMGMWVPFPEANLPEWDRSGTTPQDVATMINDYGTIFKSYFPQAQLSVMLNSMTYLGSYDNAGSYSSFLPYVQGINPGLIDSFGLQGFPYFPEATNHSADPVVDASVFLPNQLASEAADALGTTSIWYNTGTFSQTYVATPKDTVTISPSQRTTILKSIAQNAVQLQQKGYTVSINIFAGDKSDTDEGTNWSYWKNANDTSNPYISVFTNFVKLLDRDNLTLWLFDDLDN